MTTAVNMQNPTHQPSTRWTTRRVFVVVAVLWFVATWIPLGMNFWWNAIADVSSTADVLLEAFFVVDAV